jgi:energy-coupling factor transporter ATP-binding protein EcfA2
MEDPIPLARLTSVRLKNFKSFVDETAELAAPLSLLVGGNGSGKSNLFDALRFLHGLALGLNVFEVLMGTTEVGRPPWMGLRGGVEEVARLRETSFTIETRWRVEPEGIQLVHALTCQVQPTLEITHESLRIEGEHHPLFEGGEIQPTARPRPDEPGAWDWDDTSLRIMKFRSRHPGQLVEDIEASNRSSLAQLDPQMDYDERVVPLARSVRDALKRVDVLQMHPERMRAYAPQKARRIGNDGENLSAAVFHLDQRPDQKQDLVDWLSELCAPRVENIDFVVVKELNDVMLRLQEEDGFSVSVRSLSDGTLRFLGLLVALKTARAGELFLIEEPETGLHPARAGLLVELLASLAADRGCHIIATTHSPQVLLALQGASPEALGQTIVFGRSPETPGTLMRRLADLPHFAEIAERRGVDHLFTTRWLERAL